MQKSAWPDPTPVLSVFVFSFLAPSLLFLHSFFSTHRADQSSEKLVQSIELSDPILSTESRYLRHRSLSDAFAPFQDHPGIQDLYPSGAVYGPLETVSLGQAKTTTSSKLGGSS